MLLFMDGKLCVMYYYILLYGIMYYDALYIIILFVILNDGFVPHIVFKSFLFQFYPILCTYFIPPFLFFSINKVWQQTSLPIISGNCVML